MATCFNIEHLFLKNSLLKIENWVVFCVVDRSEIVVKLVRVQGSVQKIWNHDLTVLCLRPTQPWGSGWYATIFPVCLAGYPSYFDLAPSKQWWCVQWFFFFKYSCSFSFVFMDHVSPLLPLQPDSCVSLMFNSFSRQLWTTLSTSQNFIKVLEKDLWVLPVSC